MCTTSYIRHDGPTNVGNGFHAIQLDGWHRKINMLLNMLGQTVIITSKPVSTILGMSVVVILRRKESFRLVDSASKLHPAMSFAMSGEAETWRPAISSPFEREIRERSTPDSTSQSITVFLASASGAKMLATFSALQCLPVQRILVSLYYGQAGHWTRERASLPKLGELGSETS